MDQVALIRTTLAQAHELDAAARELRRRAGHLLAELRQERPADWSKVCDLDQRTGSLLIAMAIGAETGT